MKVITEKCKKILSLHYGSKFKGLILYGSTARRTNDRLSDIDLLVLLKQPFNYFRELRTITTILYPVQLETNHLISARPVAIEDFKQGRLQLYRNALKEGLRI